MIRFNSSIFKWGSIKLNLFKTLTGDKLVSSALSESLPSAHSRSDFSRCVCSVPVAADFFPSLQRLSSKTLAQQAMVKKTCPSVISLVLLCSGYDSKVPWTGRLIDNTHLFLTVLEARGSKIKASVESSTVCWKSLGLARSVGLPEAHPQPRLRVRPIAFISRLQDAHLMSTWTRWGITWFFYGAPYKNYRWNFSFF